MLVLVSTACAWKPPGQVFATEYVTAQEAPAAAGAELGAVYAAVCPAAIGAELSPGTFTAKEFVARPAPPCHSSKPASTSMRYQDFWIQPRLIASATNLPISRSCTEVVPVTIE